MTRTTKKEDELRALNAYLAAAAIRPDQPVEQCERPDFLLTIGAVQIGVEVTDFHVAGNRREIEEHWGRLRQWPRLLNDFPRYRYVKLHLRALRLPSRQETQAFVGEVFDLTVGAAVLPTTITVTANRYPTLSKYVDRVDVEDTKIQYLGWNWNHDIAWIGVDEDELMEIVKAKRSSTVVAASSYWLMITEGASLSRVMAFIDHGWLEAMPRLTRELEQSAFDRLILLQSPIIEWRRDEGWRTIADNGEVQTNGVLHTGSA